MSARLFVLVSSTLVCLMCASCELVGPASVNAGRPRYNHIIAKTADEQTLLNLVKLRYAERPTLLDVSSISSSVNWGAGLNAQGGVTRNPELGFVSGSLNYSESPTITYTPLRGESYVRQILSPLPIDTIVLLIQSGWPVDHVLRLTVQEINHLRNITLSSYMDDEEVAHMNRFEETLDIMRDLQIDHDLDWALRGAVDTPFPTMDLVIRHDTDEERRKVKRLKELLKLDIDSTRYKVVYGVGYLNNKSVTMVTRSISDMNFYLSQAVEVPQEDIDSGVAVRYPVGTKQLWDDDKDTLLRIRYSETRPKNALVFVEYRGLYFYIADNDISSKWTFLLLQMLIDLKSGSQESLTPILTIPVGR